MRRFAVELKRKNENYFSPFPPVHFWGANHSIRWANAAPAQAADYGRFFLINFLNYFFFKSTFPETRRKAAELYEKLNASTGAEAANLNAIIAQSYVLKWTATTTVLKNKITEFDQWYGGTK